VDHRADIHSPGVVFYEMLTGELPLGSFAPPSAKNRLPSRWTGSCCARWRRSASWGSKARRRWRRRWKRWPTQGRDARPGGTARARCDGEDRCVHDGDKFDPGTGEGSCWVLNHRLCRPHPRSSGAAGVHPIPAVWGGCL